MLWKEKGKLKKINAKKTLRHLTKYWQDNVGID